MRGAEIDELRQEICRFIADRILKQPDREIGVTEPLISSGIVDSFSLVDLAVFVEETFRVRIEDTELNAEHIDTVEAIAQLVQARLRT